MQCDQCAGEQFTGGTGSPERRQLYRCRACGWRITARSASALSGYRFPDDIIALTVGWYVQYPRYCCNQMGSRMAGLRWSKRDGYAVHPVWERANTKDGQTWLPGQRWRCNDCHRRFTACSTSAFSNHGFPDDVIALAIRWYVRYCLSYAEVVEWVAERGLVVDRSTIYRWVQRFLPLFEAAVRAHRHPVGEKWRVDETYIRLNGRWTYIYRTIDQDGQVVDAYFSERRNATAARTFFERAINETSVTPVQVTTDKAKCYPPALRAIVPHVKHRTSKYLNNGLERDHQHLSRVGGWPCGSPPPVEPCVRLSPHTARAG